MNSSYPYIYISGPMSGLPDFNKPSFFQAEEVLRAAGFKYIINPARLDDLVKEKYARTPQWTDYMRADLAHLVKCSSIVMLTDWHKSKGARLEADVALALGLEFFPSIEAATKKVQK